MCFCTRPFHCILYAPTSIIPAQSSTTCVGWQQVIVVSIVLSKKGKDTYLFETFLLAKFKDKIYYEFIHVTMSYEAQAMRQVL